MRDSQYALCASFVVGSGILIIGIFLGFNMPKANAIGIAIDEISVRDIFAATALSGYIVRNWSMPTAYRQAWADADAMMQLRGKH